MANLNTEMISVLLEFEVLVGITLASLAEWIGKEGDALHQARQMGTFGQGIHTSHALGRAHVVNVIKERLLERL